MTSDLADLIARLERAEGADRELDALIYAATRYDIADLSPDWREHDGFRFISRAGWTFDVDAWKVDEFTGSVDAALSLAPAGKSLTINFYPRGYDRNWAAEIWTGNGGPTFAAWGSTGALALCIAALRARENSNA